MPKVQVGAAAEGESRTFLKTIGAPGTELATATRTRATRWPVSLTAFSRTDRTVPDYGIYAGHPAGR